MCVNFSNLHLNLASRDANDLSLAMKSSKVEY